MRCLSPGVEAAHGCYQRNDALPVLNGGFMDDASDEESASVSEDVALAALDQLASTKARAGRRFAWF